MENHSAAAEKNKQPILTKLAQHFSEPGLVLEIGSGSGQHALFYAQQLPQLCWLATETAENIAALQRNLQPHTASNLPAPLQLDVQDRRWPVDRADYIFTANTLHILTWPLVADLFRGIGRTLRPGGLLCIYGAMRYKDNFTSDSNAQFDRWLKDQDPARGIRDFEDVDRLAHQQELTLVSDYRLPSHNQLLIWEMQPTKDQCASE